MKSITNRLFEAISKGISEALSISASEAHYDVEQLENADMAEKKQLAAKYGIESKKAAEIKHAIYEYLRILRNAKTTFTKEDVFDYYNLFVDGEPTTYNKVKDFYDKESRAFLEYLKGYEEECIMNNPRLMSRCHNNLKMLTTNSMNSYNDNYIIKKYNNICKYLEESTDEYQAQAKVTTSNKDLIKDKLTAEMKDFKQKCLDDVKKNSTKFYNNIPASIERSKTFREKYEKELQDIFDKWFETYEGKYNKDYYGGRIPSLKTAGWMTVQIFYRENQAASSLKTSIDELNNGISSMQYISKKYTLEEYVAQAIEEAKKEFEARVDNISIKLSDKGINGAEVEVENVYEDPKCFEMFIHDNNIRLYARSIWAAEYSDKVKAHLRFIITNRPK